MIRSARLAGVPLLLLLVAALGACSSNRYALDFTPSPAEVLVAPEAGGDPALARVLVTVRDAERAYDDDTAPFEMRLRLRVENLGHEALALETGKMLLVDADLLPFLGPRLVAHEADGGLVERDSVHLPAGATGLYDLAFPLPGGVHPQDLNLAGLNLRWTVVVGERAVLLSTTFSRRQKVNVYADPFYGYPYHSSLHTGYYGWH